MSETKRALEPESPKGTNKRQKVDDDPENYALVFFDIETTDLKISKAEIIQIAAKCGSRVFQKQILPSKPLEKIITDITGISVVGKVMYDRKKNVLETVSKSSAMKSFIDFLASLDDRVVLIAHYGHGFDAPIVMRVMKEVGMLDDFKKTIFTFSDTYPLLQSLLPERGHRGKNYKLPALAKEFLGIENGLHEAMNDVMALEKLTAHTRIRASVQDFIKFRRSSDQILDDYKYIFSCVLVPLPSEFTFATQIDFVT